MKIININGPINSGKSTVSKLLKEKLPDCLFIEVDDLLSDEEKEKLNLSREEGWAERLKRLNKIIENEKIKRNFENIIFAYPMTDKMYQKWKLWEDENTKFINITLAPPLDVCLKNRGTRELTDRDKERICQMYGEGYQAPQFSDLIIDNSKQTPKETLKKILDFLSLSIRRAVPEDAALIKKIHVETYRKSYRGYVSDAYLDNMPLDQDVIERTKKYLENTECWLTLYNKTPVAFAYVTYPENGAFEINALYVHPKYQKCGAGSLLVHYLCKEKKKINLSKCIAWTMKFGPSVGFYEKMGFKKTDEEKVWQFDIPIIKTIKKI